MIARSKLFHRGRRARSYHIVYYRNPFTYFAAGTLAAGYNKRDVEAVIAKLWEWRISSKLIDPVTLDYMRSEHYFMRTSWRSSTAARVE